VEVGGLLGAAGVRIGVFKGGVALNAPTASGVVTLRVMGSSWSVSGVAMDVGESVETDWPAPEA
jgi:uncharacterized membrane protein HdeD (DUF308 family)